MVKVVGKDPKAIKQVTCLKCSSILEYTLNEVLTYSAGDYSGDTWKQSYISCPTCLSRVNVRGY